MTPAFINCCFGRREDEFFYARHTFKKIYLLILILICPINIIYILRGSKAKQDHTDRLYIHKPDSGQVNETHKIPWDFEIQTDQPISVRRQDLVLINKEERTIPFPVQNWNSPFQNGISSVQNGNSSKWE